MPKNPHKQAGLIGSAAEVVGKAETSIMLIFLSNVGDNLKNLFTSQQSVFQYTTFILSLIGLAVASIKLAFAPNKHLGKVSNLLLAAGKVVIAGLMTFAAFIFTPAIAPIVATALFFTLMAIDTLIAAGKAIYFSVKAQLADSPADKTLFQGKANKNAKGSLIGGIILGAFVITIIAAPYVGVSVVAGVGIVAGIIAASAVLFSIGKAIHQTLFQTESNEVSQEKLNQENNLDDLEETEESSLTVEELKETHKEPHSTYATELELLHVQEFDTTPVVIEQEGQIPEKTPVVTTPPAEENKSTIDSIEPSPENKIPEKAPVAEENKNITETTTQEDKIPETKTAENEKPFRH